VKQRLRNSGFLLVRQGVFASQQATGVATLASLWLSGSSAVGEAHDGDDESGVRSLAPALMGSVCWGVRLKFNALSARDPSEKDAHEGEDAVFHFNLARARTKM